MRPPLLYPLFAPLTSLRGIAAKMGGLYKKLCGEHVVDLLWHLPVGMIDRSYSPQLKYADRDRVATLTLNIVEHDPPSKPSLPYRIVGVDSTDQLIITYFNVKGDYLSNLYPANAKITVSGLLERYRANWTMNHPDYAVPFARAHEIPKFEPVYPLTAGVTGKMLRNGTTNLYCGARAGRHGRNRFSPRIRRCRPTPRSTPRRINIGGVWRMMNC
jgi:ATP-dependent DNA helicase RecG